MIKYLLISVSPAACLVPCMGTNKMFHLQSASVKDWEEIVSLQYSADQSSTKNPYLFLFLLS